MTGKKTILIADDDRNFVGALKARCLRLGVGVVTAYDTLATVLKIKDIAPDVVCLDLNMPGGSGLNVCEMLSFDARKRSFPLIQKSVPIVALTGQTDPLTIKRCRELGAYYVPKGKQLWVRIEPLLRQLLDVTHNARKRMRPVDSSTCQAEDEMSILNVGESAAQGEVSARNPATAYCLPGRRELLVIEDDPGVVEVVRHFVDQTGFTVVHCDGLEDARRLAWSAAAVLCDIHMPRSRGTFVISELRKDGFNGPIVVITGDSTPVTVMECARCRVEGILLKPFSRSDLLQKLNRIVKSTPAPEFGAPRGES